VRLEEYIEKTEDLIENFISPDTQASAKEFLLR